MSEEPASTEGQGTPYFNRAFVLRVIWDDDTQKWRVQLRPTDGKPPLVFEDLESAFLHVAQFYTDSSGAAPDDLDTGSGEPPSPL